MLILISIFTLLILLSLVFIFYLILAIFTGAPYLGSDLKSIEEIINIADIKKGKITADLGSGDGRIVLAMAKKGAVAHGYEINPFYVILSRLKIYKAGYSGNAFIHWKNFWHEDFSKFDVISVYGISYIMKKLESKLKKEIKSGAIVVSKSYSFKNWEPKKKKGFIFVYSI